MNPISRLRRTTRLPRAAMVALAFGTVAAAATPAAAQDRARQQRQQQPAAAAQVQFSQAYREAGAPVEAALQGAKDRPEVVAAVAEVKAAKDAAQGKSGEAARQANAAVDAALAELQAALAADKAKVEALFPLATTPDDRASLGQLALNLGTLSEDNALQRRGISTILASGKANPAIVPRYHFFLGTLAFEARDWAAARTSLQAAMAAGFNDNDVDVLLADTYLNDNQVPQGLALLKQAIDKRHAAGQRAPESWYRRALNVARAAQLMDAVGEWGGAFGETYPTPANWRLAIAVLEQAGKYSDQEALDLRRLMGRTNSYGTGDDYLRYIEVADPRRLPGEVLKVIEAGNAAGKLNASDSFLTQARTLASGRVAADRATLPSTERDARAASATAATLNSAGDAFLSYGEAAKAEEFYARAVAKGGIDTDRALTRIGIAQADQGKYAEALATFAKVGGARAPIARLWAAYVRQKMRPAT